MKRDRVIDDKEREATADFVMDLLKNADEANTAHRARSETDDEERQEKQFIQGFAVALNERLQGSGILCTGVLPDGHGRGYRVYCRDRQGRPYTADLGFDEWLDTAGRVGGDAGREMLGVVAQRVFDARAHYFKRMVP